MLLLLSVPLRTYVLFCCSLSRRFFSIFLGETTGDSETSVACIEMLNRHSDRQLIAYSAYAYKSLSLSHVFVSALSTSNIRPLLHLPSRLAHWDLLLSIESRIDGPSVGQAPVLLHGSSPSFSRIHLTRVILLAYFALYRSLLSPRHSTILAYRRHPLVSPEF